MIVFLHTALFVALSSFNPASVISLLHASYFRRFGRPLFPLVCPHLAFFSLCAPLSSSSHGRAYHFSRFSVISLDACASLVVALCSFRILSSLVTPHIHLSILISFTSSRASSLEGTQINPLRNTPLGN